MADITPQESSASSTAHHRPGRRQARRRHRAAQPLAPACSVDPALRDEITPKNILMIGPTGVGKTEIARRLAQAGRRALHQGRGDQVHRGRLRRPRRRVDHPRPGRRGRQDGARAGDGEGAGSRRRSRPRSASSTSCCPSRSATPGTRTRRRCVPSRPTRERFRKQAARGRAGRPRDRDRGERRGRSVSRSWRRPAWRR